MHTSVRTASLEALRQRIRAIEKRGPGFAGTGPDAPLWQTGVRDLDGRLPASGLPVGAVHTLTGASPADTPAVAAFAKALITRLPGAGDILWCQSFAASREYGALYGPGFLRFGITPARLIVVSTNRHADLAWALEEGARAGSLAAVIGESASLSFTASRRLSLAAKATATPVLLVDITAREPASAAASRWRISPAPAPADPFDAKAPGALSWQVTLTRCRGGRPGDCDVEWNDETHSFCLAARSGHRMLPVRGNADEPAAAYRESA